MAREHFSAKLSAFEGCFRTLLSFFLAWIGFLGIRGGKFLPLFSVDVGGNGVAFWEPLLGGAEPDRLDELILSMEFESNKLKRGKRN